MSSPHSPLRVAQKGSLLQRIMGLSIPHVENNGYAADVNGGADGKVRGGLTD